jgi:hypothetical protein
MAAGKYDIVIEQGASFSMTITWKDSTDAPVNLGGYTARMQVRTTHDSPEALVSLTSGSGITLGGALGTIEVAIAPAVTAALPPSDAVYDLELQSSGGDVTRLLQGSVTISPEVTR